MTGHQVWTSLHANSAMAIFDRLRDQGVEDYKLSDPRLLTGLTAQRLVKVLCPHCSLRFDQAPADALPADLRQSLLHNCADFLDAIRLVNQQGCAQCTRGYKGRIVLAEVICPDQGFLDLMAEGKRVAAQQYWCDHLHGMSIAEHGWLRMIAGDVDPRDLRSRVGPMPEMDAARRAALVRMGLELEHV
jgi:type II secretory ATPase GspE/PulE/Tfp pilus assembly ATPase PilB-like protein